MAIDVVTLALAKKYTDEHGGGSGLPPVEGHAGEFLSTNGTETNWGKIFHGDEIQCTPEGELVVGDVVYTFEKASGYPWETDLDNTIYSATFSPDGTKLVLGGQFTGYAKLYSISGSTVTFVSNIYSNAGTTALSSNVYSSVFSPDGTKLFLGGNFSGYAKLYSVSGNTITYLQDIYADTGTTALSSYIQSAVFSPDGAKLVLGGNFTGYAKLYSVLGNTITYLQDIYADTETTALNSYVYSATFSPDGTKLVLGGAFSGRTKLYSVSSNTITYLQDIYADAETTALDSTVRSASFSPAGTKLVLGGEFTGKAKLYSVSGNMITYLQDIYADTETTTLSSTARSATFSPDGTKLILGGWFTGYAKLYSISGNTVTYLQDIYANTGIIALDNWVSTVTLSPDGTKLVLGGAFTSYAKLYSVSSTSVTFIPYEPTAIHASSASSGLPEDFKSIGYISGNATGGKVTVTKLTGPVIKDPAKASYTKAETDAKITEIVNAAIANAIGGGY